MSRLLDVRKRGADDGRFMNSSKLPRREGHQLAGSSPFPSSTILVRVGVRFSVLTDSDACALSSLSPYLLDLLTHFVDLHPGLDSQASSRVEVFPAMVMGRNLRPTPGNHVSIHPTFSHASTDWMPLPMTQSAPPPQFYQAGSQGLSCGSHMNERTGHSWVDARDLALSQEQYLRSTALLHLQHQRMLAAGRVTQSDFAQSHSALSGQDESSTSAPTVSTEPLRLDRPVALTRVSSHQIPLCLPVIFAQSVDELVLSGHQALLRQQIELFQATDDDISARIRGRNHQIYLGQVGIRCRHCAHVPASFRQKATVYFPATTLGLYQAAQNMSSSHIQCGLCPFMPQDLKDKFKELIPTKNTSSRGGRSYWTKSAQQMGLVDSDKGIWFIRDHMAPLSSEPRASFSRLTA